MRYAILSDIHSNRFALAAVLEEIKKQQIEKIVCCGDIVGYGPAPKVCLQTMQALLSHTSDEKNRPLVVKGNHDYAAATGRAYNFNDAAREAALWTHQQLSSTDRDWLDKLPYIIEEDNFLMVHSAPYQPETWQYIIGLGEIKQAFDCFSHTLCFIGHTHLPFIAIKPPVGKIILATSATVKLQAGHRYLINVGSVGQPRDKDPRAAYIIYDNQERTLHLKRIKYDIEACQTEMKKTGLPKALISRLAVGL